LPCTSTVQGLRRNLPFFPVPWQAFIKNIIKDFGDGQNSFFRFEQSVHKITLHQ
jgi:hypothetical protein